jgi:hypothetical protein
MGCGTGRVVISRRALLGVQVAALLLAGGSQLAKASETAVSDDAIATVTVVGTGVSNMDAASAGDVTQEDLASQPLLRPGAVLENVPGLIVTQHWVRVRPTNISCAPSTWITAPISPRKWMTCRSTCRRTLAGTPRSTFSC